MMLPLGDWTKDAVRAKADELDLGPVADKPDSQEICFVPDDDYARVVRERSAGAVRPGSILDLSGQVLGEHPGYQHYTIGQRRGLGVATGEPVYVTHIDPAANTVTLGPRESLLTRDCAVSDLNWLMVSAKRRAEGNGLRASIKIRYKAQPVLGTIRAEDDTARVEFGQPVSAVTPGQAAVFYDDDGLVLGGGWIE
jgi:tRNA-specific 2-thiouridylase